MTEVRIITFGQSDIGCLQSFLNDDTLFLAQLFVDGAWRRQVIGTEVVKDLVEEAASAGRTVTLGVVETNPALRLYKRLGFRIIHEDERNSTCAGTMRDSATTYSAGRVSAARAAAEFRALSPPRPPARFPSYAC